MNDISIAIYFVYDKIGIPEKGKIKNQRERDWKKRRGDGDEIRTFVLIRRGSRGGERCSRGFRRLLRLGFSWLGFELRWSCRRVLGSGSRVLGRGEKKRVPSVGSLKPCHPTCTLRAFAPDDK